MSKGQISTTNKVKIADEAELGLLNDIRKVIEENEKSQPLTKDVEDEGKEDPLINPKRLIIGSLIIGLGFLISIVFFSNSSFGLGVSGIIVFFTVLIGSDIFSGSTKLDTGEVRKAIAISFVFVYFMLIGFPDTKIAGSAVTTPLLNNFWWIVAVIIGFYFAGRSAEKIVKTRPKTEKIKI